LAGWEPAVGTPTADRAFSLPASLTLSQVQNNPPAKPVKHDGGVVTDRLGCLSGNSSVALSGEGRSRPPGRRTRCARRSLGGDRGPSPRDEFRSIVHRYYDPVTSQFLSVDPAAELTETPYAFTSGDPVNESDPTGMGGAAHPEPCNLNPHGRFCGGQHLTLLQGAGILVFGVGSIACLGLCDLAAAAGGGGSVLTWLSQDSATTESEAQSLSAEEQQTYDDVCNNANNLAHVFAEKHGFGDLIQEFGTEQNVLRQVIYSLREAPLPESGIYTVVVRVGGSSVQVGGSVVNGVARIGTARVVQ